MAGETVSEKKLLLTMKEVIWILSFIVTMFLSYMKFESRMREVELKLEQYKESIKNNDLKFNKIDTKLDVITEGITNIKIELNKKEDKK